MGTISRIMKLSDRQILNLIDIFKKELQAEVSSIYIGGVPVELASEAISNISTGKDIGAISAFNLTLGAEGVSVKFRRGIGGAGGKIDVSERKPSPYFDEIVVDAPANNQSNAQTVVDAVIKARRLIIENTSLPSENELLGSASEAVDLLKHQFSQMNDQLLEVNTASLKRREELEDEYLQKRQSLEDELAKHAEQARSRNEELELKHKERLVALEEREKQLDNRDHIHARRELRTHMTDAIAAQLQGHLVPKNAATMRWSIFGLLMVGAVLLVGLSAWSLLEFGRVVSLAASYSETRPASDEMRNAVSLVDRGFHWLILLRGFVAGAFAIGFLLYAISWLKRVYQDEVDTRRELQRYATDLNRASWSIETIMEAKLAGDVVIPEAVIESVTRNLFDFHGSKKITTETSANALAELLRTSGRARFGPNGAEFELSGRGANRLAEKIDPE